MASLIAVGIDLGTTYTCVGAWFNGKVRIIRNEQGNTTTPSFVAYTAKKRLIGEAAKNQVVNNPANTVYDSKRLIGRRFDDPLVQRDIKNWSFKVVDDGQNNPKIEVEYLNETHLFTPEEISATILTNVKLMTEKIVRQPVTDVVVTVPAYFNNSQRQATKDAGSIAGLNVLQIINEPTAAALAYGLEQKVQGTQNVLIYDLGGGTFDVSIIKIVNGENFEVKAVAGDNHLGGEDFDDLLVEHFAKEFESQHNLDLRGNARALRKLRTACERAKRTLSATHEASVEIECLFEGHDFSSTITRSRFELMCANLFQTTIQLVGQALNDANCSKRDINEVVMVGGSTRIPKIQQLVSDFFDQKELNKTMNPDEAVAYGAAVQAAKLANIDCCEVQNVKLYDIVPLSLGTEVDSGEMVIVIPKNSKIPCEFTKVFFKVYDRQTEALISVHEGERRMAADNNLLAELIMTNISPGHPNDIKIDVTFILNADGILTARAKERNKANTREIEINIRNGRLTKNELEQMLVQAVKHTRIDEEENQKKLARKLLVTYIKQCEEAIADAAVSCQLSASDKQEIQERCEMDSEWLIKNENLEKAALEARLRDLKRLIDTFAWNFNKNKLI